MGEVTPHDWREIDPTAADLVCRRCGDGWPVLEIGNCERERLAGLVRQQRDVLAMMTFSDAVIVARIAARKRVAARTSDDPDIRAAAERQSDGRPWPPPARRARNLYVCDFPPPRPAPASGVNVGEYSDLPGTRRCWHPACDAPIDHRKPGALDCGSSACRRYSLDRSGALQRQLRDALAVPAPAHVHAALVECWAAARRLDRDSRERLAIVMLQLGHGLAADDLDAADVIEGIEDWLTDPDDQGGGGPGP